MKAISHTPDRDRVLPIVPEGTREREGGRQGERKGGSSERKTVNQRHERERWMDNGEKSDDCGVL